MSISINYEVAKSNTSPQRWDVGGHVVTLEGWLIDFITIAAVKLKTNKYKLIETLFNIVPAVINIKEE